MCVPPRNWKTEENISLLYLGEAFISMPHLPWILQEAFKSSVGLVDMVRLFPFY